MLNFIMGFIAGAVVASLPMVRGLIYTAWGKIVEARKRGGW
jgi:Flp pilus assembly pilin Flp